MTHVAIIPSSRQATRNQKYGTSSLERDRREASSVVAHALQRVAAIAEEILRRRQRVVAGRLDRDADLGDAMHQVARQVEQRNGRRAARRGRRRRWLRPAPGTARGTPGRPRRSRGRCRDRPRRESFSRRAPSFSIAAIVASTTPLSAPFQPACAAPITPAVRSASSTGAQSAAITPSTTSGRSVTSPSALGAPGEVQRSVSTVSTSVEWIWYSVRRSGSAAAEDLGDAPAVLAHVVGAVARAIAAVQRRIEAGC